MRNEAVEEELSSVIHKVNSLYGGIMHEIETILLSEPSTEEAVAEIGKYLVILARAFLEYEEEITKKITKLHADLTF